MPKRERVVLRVYQWATFASVTVYLVVALVLALSLPYHEWDALAYGEWSRLIGQDLGFHYEGITAQTYHRPLFYVIQGWLWWPLGWSFWSGRLLSLAFGMLLILAVAVLARDSRARFGGFGSALALLVILLVPDVARYLSAGLTDVPVAALVGATAAVLWMPRLGTWRVPLVASLSLLAVLAKPTALIALASLMCADALGSRADVRSRLRRGALPIGLGAGAALVYDVSQARYVEMGLPGFLRAGVDAYYEQLAAEARLDAILELAPLGRELRLPLAFAIVYTLFRIAGVSHRGAGFASAVIAIAWSVGGPMFGTEVPSPVESRLPWLAFALFLALIVAAAAAPPHTAPSRLRLARLAVFAFPAAVIWLLYGAYDTRLLSVAWPGLLALIPVVLTAGVRWFATVAPVAALVPVPVFLLLAVANGANLDGLGRDGWGQLRENGWAALRDGEIASRVVLPSFTDTRALVESELGADGRVFSSEGRFRFYFPGKRSVQAYPRGCGDLRDFDVFVLLTDPLSRTYIEDVVGASGDSGSWQSCTSPRLQRLTDGANGYAVFRVDD